METLVGSEPGDETASTEKSLGLGCGAGWDRPGALWGSGLPRNGPGPPAHPPPRVRRPVGVARGPCVGANPEPQQPRGNWIVAGPRAVTVSTLALLDDIIEIGSSPLMRLSEAAAGAPAWRARVSQDNLK